MEKKSLYYDGSGHGINLFIGKKTQGSIEISGEQRKNVSGNPYIINWNLVKKLLINLEFI